MRVAAPTPRSAWIRISSRSSSEPASSLRLVKMSTMPRPIADDDRERPAVSRASQLRFGGGESTGAPVSLEAVEASEIGGASSADGASGAGAGDGALSLHPNIRFSNPTFGFSAPLSLNPHTSRPCARATRAPSYHPMTPEETRARLLYRDGLMLILDKPAGIAVHKGPKGGESLEDDFDALRFGLPRNPALAHRLDRETAGCLVLGRHHKALEKLGLLFKQGKVAKTYWAVVAGGPAADEGLIDKPLGRLDATRGWWMKVDPDGQPAQTRWRVLGRGEWRGAPIAWLALSPLTGRTHQLRVHAASESWSILGDRIYGEAAAVPLQLLARRIEVPISKNKPPVIAVAPAPEHMRATLAACGFAGDQPSEAVVELSGG